MIGKGQNPVFAVETAQGRQTAQRQRREQKRPISHGHTPTQRPHFPYILLVQHVNHGTGRQKQERFEKRVSSQMVHCRSGTAQADGHDHVSEL